MFKSFIKDSFLYLIPALVSRGISFFLVPFYTRVLSPGEYGSLDLLLVFASIVNLTITLEVSQGLARLFTAEVDLNTRVKYASTAFWFVIFCYTLFAVIAISVKPLASIVMGQSDMDTAFRAGILYIWANGVFYFVQNQLRWELRSKQYTIVSLLMSFTAAVVSMVLVYQFQMGIVGILIGLSLASLTSSALAINMLSRSIRFIFDKKYLSKMLAFSIPLVLSGVAIWITSSIDRIMLKSYLSIESVGIYGVSHRLAAIAGLTMVGFQTALTPLIYKHYEDEKTPVELADIFRCFLFIALVCFITLSLFVDDILYLFTTSAYYQAADVIYYLVPAVFLSSMYIFAPGLSIRKKTHFFIWISLLGACLVVSLNFWLIPHLGIVGAGISSLVAYLSTFLLHMYFSQKLYPVPHNWAKIVVFILFAVLLVGINKSLDLSHYIRWFVSSFSVVIYVFTGITIGFIPLSVMSKFKELVKSRFGTSDSI